MKRFVVIAYDIEKNKKRREVAKLLQQWGKRVNRSVFECYLSDHELDRLKVKLAQLARRGEDVILFYQLCRLCIEKNGRIGAFPQGIDVVKVF